MKKINFKNHGILKAGLILVLVAFISSCDWIDPELNVDPDAPGDVPMNLLVPAIQQQMGFNLMGNNSVRTTNIWMQYYDGTARQSETEAAYQLTAADVNNLWSAIYTEILNELRVLTEKAIEEESPHNEGIAKVMTAYTLGIASDLFGSIPYSDGLKGSDNVLEPTFDSQEAIYSAISTLLNEAIDDLGSDEETVGIDGDVIYGGDAAAWMAAAHAIYARAELQLSEVNGGAAYTAALSHVASAIASNGADMEVPFETSNQNPVFQFMEQRGDFRICQTFLDELNATADPRLAYYASPNPDAEDDVIVGSAAGMADETASYPGTYQSSGDSPIVLISYAEVKFIEAEALLSSDPAGAAAAFNAAVLASLEKVTGVADQDWMDANNITASAGNITLESIISQKRIALIGQIQPFSDWRRTGIPTLALADGATKTAIPRRFPYSQDESIYNPDNVPSIGSILDPVWWDQ